jgi:hypothetical protein
MRARLFQTSATIVTLVVASCGFPTTRADTCAEDPDLCPPSAKTATSVTCDCHCTIGFTEDSGQNFEGRVPMCLPPELNAAIATKEQQVALDAFEARDFNQRVFQFCSKDVAAFLRTWIRMPGHLVLACATPVRCDCGTAGTQLDTEVCHSSCNDTACSTRNCPSALNNEGAIDLTACFCSRASSCGAASPVTGTPAVCRDWTHRPTSTLQTK